ncbi:MAG: hypothetical protein WD317_03560 [Balneolaceae bacterium]
MPDRGWILIQRLRVYQFWISDKKNPGEGHPRAHEKHALWGRHVFSFSLSLSLNLVQDFLPLVHSLFSLAFIYPELS